MTNTEQQTPGQIGFIELMLEIKKGIIQVPKFQRDFVWSIEKTAQLLDSILKGYPIGTFILWETSEKMASAKKIGNLKLPDAPKGKDIKYVLDGQQRITSLYASYSGAVILKAGTTTKHINYADIYVDLEKDINDDDEQIVTHEKPPRLHISFNKILNHSDYYDEIEDEYERPTRKIINLYASAIDKYDFSTVTLQKEKMESAIEVFTRINTGGTKLTLFEIMCAKTYNEDEDNPFDMQKKWNEFQKKLEIKNYGGISSTNILHLLSIMISDSQECKRSTILKLDKEKIIATWDEAISAMNKAIDYFRNTLKIKVSKLLPYDALLVPFAYFLNNENNPNMEQSHYLEEFFWRTSLSGRYVSATESKLAQDIKRMISILENKQLPYDNNFNVAIESDDLINTNLAVGSSFCKAILCLLTSQVPKNLKNCSDVTVDNSNLSQSNSKNYHHFFPRSYLKKNGTTEDKALENSIVNITLISAEMNQNEIRDNAPSEYIAKYESNPRINDALQTHFIDRQGFGIDEDDYQTFLQKRAERISEALKSRLNPE